MKTDLQKMANKLQRSADLLKLADVLYTLADQVAELPSTISDDDYEGLLDAVDRLDYIVAFLEDNHDTDTQQ